MAWTGDSCGVPATAATDHGVDGVGRPRRGVVERVRSLHGRGDWQSLSSSVPSPQAVATGRSSSRHPGARLVAATSSVGLPDLARRTRGAGARAGGLNDLVRWKDGWEPGEPGWGLEKLELRACGGGSALCREKLEFAWHFSSTPEVRNGTVERA